jgi:N-acyl homoserine lactone hydrolase
LRPEDEAAALEAAPLAGSALPLPGGCEGATVRLHPLLCGEFRAAPAWFHREEGLGAGRRALGIGVPAGDFIRAPIVAFLLEHPTAGPIVVDTGLDPSVAEDPRPNLGRFGSRALPALRMRPEQAVPAQLESRGVDVTAVRVALMTHLHLDHASGMRQFPEATFLISRPEWQFAKRPLAILRGYVRRHFAFTSEPLLLDFEAEGRAFASFAHSLDVFGDGAVRLVSTPGHTAGHYSLIVRLRDGEALLTGDAVYTMHNLRTGHLPWRFYDRRAYVASLRAMQLFARDHPEALVVPGHDMDAWRELEAVY